MLCSLSMRATIIGAGGGEDGIISPRRETAVKDGSQEHKSGNRPAKAQDFGFSRVRF